MIFLLIASYPASILKFRGALLSALQQAGLQIHIAAPDFDDYPEDVKTLKALGYHLHSIPMQRTGTNPIQDSKTLFALYKLMRYIKPDYVLGYTIKPVIYGLLSATLARVPHRYALITGLGYAFQGSEDTHQKKSKLQILMHSLYSLALSNADKVFFQNPDDEALFRKMGIMNSSTPSKVVNGSGVDLAEYKVTSLPASNGQPLPHFLLIARLLGDKGVREYVRAASIIKSRHPQTKFDLVGWIDDNPDAIAQSELDQWIDDGLVNFWGKLADVKPAIEACSIYVLPSYREGTPRTVLEAMAMGRPIITTDAPGCRETVRDGENGFLVPVKSVDNLVKAMEKYILSPELIVSMGNASRHLVEERFDVHKVNQVMMTEMGIKTHADN